MFRRLAGQRRASLRDLVQVMHATLFAGTGRRCYLFGQQRSRQAEFPAGIVGILWREWAFMVCMILGCFDEMIGYGGRIMLYHNPFSFMGFLMQIICITTAPVFYCDAIYILLARIVIYLGRQYSRFPPRLFYWIFIPCDVISLVLQAAGGALSSLSSGTSKTANDITLAGLCFQVITLAIFTALCLDCGNRCVRKHPTEPTSIRFKSFVLFLALAVIFILIRCCYRIDELSDGYYGPLIHNQGLFIAFEGW